MALAETSETGLFISSLVVLAISTLIFIPIEAYFAYKIYDTRESLVMYVLRNALSFSLCFRNILFEDHHRHCHQFRSKRKPGLMLTSVIASQLFYFGDQVVFLVAMLLGGRANIHMTGLCILYPILYVSWFPLVARMWLLYFTINHSIAVIDEECQQVIEAKAKCDNFFINEKQNWGSWQVIRWKILKYAMVAYIFDVGYVMSPNLKDAGMSMWFFVVFAVVYCSMVIFIPMCLLIKV